MSQSNEHICNFETIRYGWNVGFTAPEYQGSTDIHIHTLPEKKARILVMRKGAIVTRKSRILKKEELEHLRQVLATSFFQFDNMPCFACDASTSNLKISGDCWVFTFGGYDTGSQPGMTPFFEVLQALYEPILMELNRKIKAKLVMEGNYNNIN